MRRRRSNAEAAEQLAPFLKNILRSGGSGGAGNSAGTDVGAHDLGGSLHTGTLRTDQAPWAVTQSQFGSHQNTINAHLGLAANSGLTTSGSLLTLGTPGTLTGTSANAVSGTSHTHAITASDNGQSNINTIVRSSASGGIRMAYITTPLLASPGSDNTTIQPGGDLILDPVGNDVRPETNYDINMGSLSKKWLTLYAAELWVETLVAQDTIATIGGRILVGPTTTLIADLSTGATTIDVKHNQMASGDRVYMEANGKLEWLAITSSASTITGGYRYSVTRNLDGTGANQWYAGDAVFNTGTTGNGFIDLYSLYGVPKSGQTSTQRGGPTIAGNVRLSSTFNDIEERWGIGNLDGLYDYGTETYGFAAGDPDGAWIGVDATNGLRIMNNGSTEVIRLDTSGNSYFAGVMSIGTSGEIRQGENWGAGTFTGLRIWNQSNIGRIAGYNGGVIQWYANTDGKLYFGGGAGVLDINGVTIDAATGDVDDLNAYTFDLSGTTIGGLYASSTSGTGIQMLSTPPTSSDASVRIEAISPSASDKAFAYVVATSSDALTEAIILAKVDGSTSEIFITADTQITMSTDTNIDGDVTTTGIMGVGVLSPTSALDVDGNTFRLRSARTPASAGATGNAGDVCFDSNYMYRCVSANTWKRVALSSW